MVKARGSEEGNEGDDMTKRQRTVRAGYVDEAVIEKLVASFTTVMNECLPTGSEIATAALRLLILGHHVHLTNGNPSATTPEIQAQLEKLGNGICGLIQASEQAQREDIQ